MLTNSRLRLALVITGLACCLGTGAALVAAKNRPNQVKVIRATLKDAAGRNVAVVELRQSRRSAVNIRVNGRHLPPGFHGMHIHAVGTCDAPDFTRATW
jgi:Cu-Zn family superoxide dismutase